MGITIKQLANELGVSKPTISNVIVQLNLQDKLRRVGNRYILTETQIDQIKLYLSEDNKEKIQSTSEKSIKSPKTPNSQNSNDYEEKTQSQSKKLIKSPNLQNDILQEQLIAKDNQIGQITSAMENLTASLNAEQALHAGTIQKQLAEHSTMNQSYDTEQPKQKQSFFARLFGKKEN